MRTRRRWGTIVVGGALGLSFLMLIVLGTVPPEGHAGQGSEPPAPAPPAWMHALAPGEQPPQFVLFSFDGAGSHGHWQRVLETSRSVGAHVTGFLSGTYLLSHDRKQDYTAPGHAPGDSAIGFGGSADEVRTRIADLNAAVEAGHEIGTHYNGHFCKGQEPSVGTWSAEQWTGELDQFFRFLHGATGQGLRIAGNMIKGGRTPCLEGRFDELLPVLGRRGMTYDASQISDGIAWPERKHGVWQFWMPLVRVPALKNRKVIMMDYNLWYAMNRARDDPSRSAEFTTITLDTYRAAYEAVLAGNRAPLVVGNHFNDWAGGAFTAAAERFMAEVCVKPETVCATYSEVIEWLRLQDPAVLADRGAMAKAQIE
ncbi:MAG TPA: polysaccharide deacetylase [Actinophytocola sp.]|uniref:polysaccharide deacetylase n=1 Tax=Actinophytocola sp. TaxID=1872138 RepID=UPI002DDD687D|nr:polysaccharide deacetylase [Actinophytocola sp.]HEV2781578.1 polysaccharide deacetylase [Actinophytocola sp.]